MNDELKNRFGDLVDASVLDHQKADKIISNHPDLLNFGGSVWGATPLHFCVIENFPVGVKYLISKGADVNKPDSYGDTPLMSAALCGKADLCRDLLEAGAALDPVSSLT